VGCVAEAPGARTIVEECEFSTAKRLEEQWRALGRSRYDPNRNRFTGSDYRDGRRVSAIPDTRQIQDISDNCD
jgi:hypothetical protein